MNNGEQPINALPSDVDSSKVECIRLTKREYFAAMAMQGLTSNPDWANTMTPDDWDEYTGRLTKGSVELADALLKALEEF